MSIDELLLQVKSMTDSVRSSYNDELNKTQKMFENYVAKLRANEKMLKSEASNLRGSMIMQGQGQKMDTQGSFYNPTQNTLSDSDLAIMINKEREVIRISDDLITKEKVFISPSFKSDYNIKYDKANKMYYTSIPINVAKYLQESTKLNKVNHTYSINSVTDFYILQITTLENCYKFSLTEKARLDTELKEQVNQNNALKEYIDNGNDDGSAMDLFQNELQNMKESFKRKTREFTEIELKKNNSKKLNDLNDQLKKLTTNFANLKASLSSCLNSYKTNEFTLERFLNSLSELVSEDKPIIRSNSNDKFNASFGASSPIKNRSKYMRSDSDVSYTDDGKNTSFVDKVVNAFDILVNEETKRIENYFNNKKEAAREEYVKQRVPLNTKVKSKGEKNYIEWTNNRNKWVNELRTSSYEKDGKSKTDSLPKKSINTMLIETKDKIKSSVGLTSDTSFTNRSNSIKNIKGGDFRLRSRTYSKYSNGRRT